jgi:hypothetical protein
LTPRPDTRLGRAIALALRAGTLIAVACLAVGFGLTLFDGAGGPGSTPIVDALRFGGPDALIAAGLLALTLTPPAALGTAAVILELGGERRWALLAAGVVLLLLGSLAIATALAPRVGR